MPTWLVPTLKWGGIGLAILRCRRHPLRAVHRSRSSARGGRSIKWGSHGTLLDSIRDRRRGSHRRVCSGGAKEAHLMTLSRSRRPAYRLSTGAGRDRGAPVPPG